MGGVETVRKLLELDRSARAIVSSGYSDDASMADHLRHGFKAFLRKPYGPVELRETLAAVLRPAR
jgi:CheY-like chemotaxis protein